MQQETIKWLIKVFLKTKFENKDKIFEEIEEVLTNYRHLIPTFDNQKKSLGLTGLIPVDFENVTYKIPIEIWIKYDYPTSPPVCFVVPASNMKIVQGNYISSDGRFSHPYLKFYSSNPESSLAELISVLRETFSIEIPLVEKSH